MYKHQVVGVKRTDSSRPRRKPPHIVGVCTLEALDRDGRFFNFEPDDDWEAIHGVVWVNGSPRPDLAPNCRHWSLEEVTTDMRRSTPQHEFYTRHPASNEKISVHSYQGDTDLFTLGDELPVHRDQKDNHLYATHLRTGTEFRLNLKKYPVYVRDPRNGKSHEVYRQKDTLCTKVGDKYEEIGEKYGDDQGGIDLYAREAIPVYCSKRGFGLYTKDSQTGMRVPFNLGTHPLYVRNDSNSGHGQRVHRRKDGVLRIRVGPGQYEEITCRCGDIWWIKTIRDFRDPGNLLRQEPTRVPCPQKGCGVIPQRARPASRGYGQDCPP